MPGCNADSELVGALRDFSAAWQADIARAEAADRERDEARERIAALEGLLRELDDNGWIVVDHESDESCAVECSRCDAHERYDAMSNWSIKHDATCIVTRARELLGKE